MSILKLFLAAITIMVVFSCNQKEKKAEQPNILFININDFNDFVGFLDGQYNAKTPHMDRLAEKGVNFTNAHCATPACGPSRNALLFGQYPFNSGLYHYNQKMNEVIEVIRKKLPDFISIPQLLKENGYQTYGSGDIHCFNWSFEYLDGKMEWTECHKAKGKKITPIPGLGYGNYKDKPKFCPTSNDDSDYWDNDVANFGIDVLGRKHKEPFFLAVGFKEAHTPLLTPQKYYDLYPDFELEQMYPDDLDDVSPVGLQLAGNGRDFKNIQKDNKWGMVIQSYLATMSFVDNQVGRVLKALEESPYAKNTVVILWSDHGNHYGSKGKLTKFTLWEGSTRVPLVIWDTRGNEKSGRICRESTSLVDLYPTITNIAGIKTPNYVNGVDLAPWLNSPQLLRDIPAITLMGRGNYAVRTKDWRYIRYHDGSEELYHNKVDKLELKNLAGLKEFDAQKQKMKRWLPKDEAPLIDMNPGATSMFYDADRGDEK